MIHYNQEGNEELMRSELLPENEMTVETSFTHQWIFRRSDSKQYLKAQGNGMTAQIFEGCRFRARPNERLIVTISFFASTSTGSSNFITSAVIIPRTDETEQTKAITSPTTTTFTSRDQNYTTTRSTLNNTLNVPTEITSTWFSPIATKLDSTTEITATTLLTDAPTLKTTEEEAMQTTTTGQEAINGE